MELSQPQLSHIMRRFPEFELSYETISHKKVSAAYNLCMAIPTGKKMFAWFTFHQDKDVCYLLDINKEKKITKATLTGESVGSELALGTIVYGSYLQDESEWFVIEELYYYKGVSLKNIKFGEKFQLLKGLLSTQAGGSLKFCLPVMWEFRASKDSDEYPAYIPESISANIYYPVHHIQYRAIYDIMPNLNVHLNRKILPAVIKKKQSSHTFETIPFTMDINKPQYRYSTVFQVTADIQYDIYHLFAYGKHNSSVYYNTAYIPNYKKSVFMNGHFRKIRENKNIDYIEESDDEEDFQNLNEDKYVDLNKILLMECVFNRKFKRWTPVRVVDKNSKIAHIGQLGNI
jgi:hypothetical protein